MHKQYSVTVIIPIYNVRNYIAQCADSLMNQSLSDVEFIFVDDASPDDSIKVLMSVLEQYPKRQSNVKILTHTENKGLPAARNTGLSHASGEYIFHCDSDDYVEPTMLEEMYNAAKEQDADIVWCDWYLTFAQNERYMKQPSYETPLEALKAMLSGAMKYNVWNKLVKRSLYVDNNILFPAGYGMGEDLTVIKLFVYADKILHLPRAYYHYNKTNSTAFSQTYSERHLIELRHNVDDLSNFVLDNLGTGYEPEIAFLKLEAKFPFLLFPDTEKIKIWKSWYPEANRYIKQNRYITKRNQILQQWANKDLWCLVRWYNILFNKLITFR